MVLFDLGGVLANLGKPAAQMQLDMTEEDYWALWMSSPSVHSFELGEIGAGDFFSLFSGELGLPEAPEIFERRFMRWELSLLPTVGSLVKQLSEQCDLALLSNTNIIHWQMIHRQTDCFERFKHLFLSFETGYCKPADNAFNHVLESTSTSPEQILFLDDTEQNIESARRTGLLATQVHGINDVRKVLSHYAIDVSSVPCC